MAITDDAAEDLLLTYGDMVSELGAIFASMPTLTIQYLHRFCQSSKCLDGFWMDSTC